MLEPELYMAQAAFRTRGGWQKPNSTTIVGIVCFLNRICGETMVLGCMGAKVNRGPVDKIHFAPVVGETLQDCIPTDAERSLAIHTMTG